MSLSAVLTFATFIAGQTLSCTVFRRLRELGRKDLGRDEPMSLLGCLAVALGSAFSVYFGVYCAALTARRDDSYHSGMRPPRLPINTFARAVCNYEGIQEHELSIKAGQTIEITIAQEYGWVYGINVAGQGGWFPRHFWEACFESLTPVDGNNFLLNDKSTSKLAWRAAFGKPEEDAGVGGPARKKKIQDDEWAYQKLIEQYAASAGLNGLNHPLSNARGEKGGGASGAPLAHARHTSAPARTANSLNYPPKDAAVVSKKTETEKLAFGERLKSLAQTFGAQANIGGLGHVFGEDGTKIKDRIQSKDELSPEQLKLLIKLSPEDLALLNRKMDEEEAEEKAGGGGAAKKSGKQQQHPFSVRTSIPPAPLYAPAQGPKENKGVPQAEGEKKKKKKKKKKL